MRCKDCGHRMDLHITMDDKPNVMICDGESESCDCVVVNYKIVR